MDRVIEFRHQKDARKWGRFGGVGLCANALYSQNVGALSYFAGEAGQTFIEVKDRDYTNQHIVLQDDQVERLWRSCGRCAAIPEPTERTRPKVIVFSGTRSGVTAAQGEALRFLLCASGSAEEYHHGACIGADYQFDQMVRWAGVRVEAWPAAVPAELSDLKRCKAHHVHEPAAPLDRNRSMVERARLSKAGLLVACPRSMDDGDGNRSGTWATVRYAAQAKVACVVVSPEGTYHVQSGECGRNLSPPPRPNSGGA